MQVSRPREHARERQQRFVGHGQTEDAEKQQDEDGARAVNRDPVFERRDHVYSMATTGEPRTEARGVTPRPGAVDAAIRPFTRCGAPSAVETVT